MDKYALKPELLRMLSTLRNNVPGLATTHDFLTDRPAKRLFTQAEHAFKNKLYDISHTAHTRASNYEKPRAKAKLSLLTAGAITTPAMLIALAQKYNKDNKK